MFFFLQIECYIEDYENCIRKNDKAIKLSLGYI